MYKGKKLAVVIPTHNEGKNIAGVLASLPSYVDHVVVVDDASKDGTADIAQSANTANLVVLKNTENLGVGGAMQVGYTQALALGAELIVKMDGDGQMNAVHLPKLLDALIDGGYDYAKGNRFIIEGLDKMPRPRFVANVVMTFLTKMASGYWHIFDPQNGYTAIRAQALRRIHLGSLHAGYFFENDMLVHLNLLRCRVIDVPTPAVYADEVSDVRPFQLLFTFPLLLLQRSLKRFFRSYVLTDFSPIALFIGIGLLLFIGGGSFGAYTWIKSYRAGIATPTGTIALVILPIILGFQLLLQGVALDIQNTPK